MTDVSEEQAPRPADAGAVGATASADHAAPAVPNARAAPTDSQAIAARAAVLSAAALPATEGAHDADVETATQAVPPTAPPAKPEQAVQPELRQADAAGRDRQRASGTKRLLLLGAGHAHLAVLEKLGKKRGLGAEVMLVSPTREVFYSGMLPGFIAGHYPLGRCVIPLEPLLARSRVEFIAGSAVAIDPAARTVTIDGPDGERQLGYDVLSVDTGASMEPDRMDLLIPGSKLHALFVRPIDSFATAWQQLCATAAERVMRIAVVGAGAGGVELALAIRHRLPTCALTLFSGGREPAPHHSRRVQQRVAQALARAGVDLVRRSCITISPEALLLDDGSLHECDAVIMANGARPPSWLDGSGLTLDERGFIAVDANLRSLSDANVFAAGDVASRPDRPRPKSGVQAVRQAPVLAHNLFVTLAAPGRRLAKYDAPSRTLNLISCGNQYAIASWGRASFEGRWVWRWKDRIDRQYVGRFGSKKA